MKGFRAWLTLGLVLSLACRHGPGSDASPTPRVQAQQLLEAQRPAEAVPLLETLLAQHPEDLEIARDLTQAYARTGRTAWWVAELQQRTARREQAITWYMLGLARFAQSQAATPEVVAAFERALALRPSEAELHHRLGLVYLESERYPEALSPLTRAAELAPQHARFQLPLAKALSRNGKRTEAVQALHRFLAASPSPEDVTVARALMRELSDEWTRIPRAAEGKLEEALRFLYELDAPQQALLLLEEILVDYPDAAGIHALVGLSYERLDDAGRAVDAFQRAIELAPEDGQNHFYLGELYFSRQRREPARLALERAVALNPLLDLAWFRLGDLALERRDLPAANQAFTLLSFLQPQALPPRGKLALVKQLEGDWRGARKELLFVLEKEPTSVEFALRLGLLLTEQALKPGPVSQRRPLAQEASQWLTRVLEAQPDNAVASRALEQVKAL